MLVELRIHPGNWKIAYIIRKVRRDCKLPKRKMHMVPHLTLYGTFRAGRDSLPKIIECLERIGKRYDILSFRLDGFKWMQGEKGKVIYFNVVPSESLRKFRTELAKELLGIAQQTKPWDVEGRVTFHVTLGHKLSENEFRRVWSYLESSSLSQFYFPMNCLRVCLLSDRGRIIREYDLLQKRILSRTEALSRTGWKKSLELYRLRTGMEVGKRKIAKKKATYFISDLHLDHRNIIKYCGRPFADVHEMNDVLVNNWNRIVGPNDTVYFLGDMAFGRKSRPASYWIKHLNGNITFIKGSHERNVDNSYPYQILRHGNTNFLLVHDPDELPIEWEGWVIHGHKHNNNLRDYPFVNGERKTINVSAEVVNYKPVSLEFLLSLKLDSIKRMDTVDSEPQRK